MTQNSTSDQEEVVLQGIGVSPGVVIGPVFRLVNEEEHIVERDVTPREIPREINRFHGSLDATRRQIRDIQSTFEKSIGHGDASIFDAHLMVLDDRVFIEEVVRDITEKRRNAEAGVRVVSEKYAAALGAIKDAYLRERVVDVQDVARRILRNLSGRQEAPSEDIDQPSILVATELAPSETAALKRDKVLGFATDLGSPTAHTAVMARAMRIPAVVGLHDISVRVSTGDRMLMDGNKGVLIIRPTAERLSEYGHVLEVRKSFENVLQGQVALVAETRDAHRVGLSANIEIPEELDAVVSQGAEGIGLFRSEFVFLAQGHLPSEDEQAEIYERVAKRLAPAPVVIRTLDLGGDKFLSHVKYPSEMNPFMGWRAIRLCLAQPDMFRTQLRAILRASRHGNVKIMYPMITKVDEVLQAQELLESAKAELRSKGTPFDEQLPVGVMIETPSAALTTRAIAPHVSFFSVGTNDLIQYTLAVDRVNERVAYLYEPTHPAIVRLIKETIDVGHEHGVHVALCGEMGADPIMAPLLIGLGLDEISVTPTAIPLIKDAIRHLSHKDSQALAEEAMKKHSAAEIVSLCREVIAQVRPEILDLVR
ncbi:MAG: phosphoenolpyruvate--protein phosphotransferase [Verrucomicrobia bacterium]|nr:phosphoenolpyruvate--protein phosphotransferase [Verrucomicrobiota bacterium]MDA1087594.1 phosphoenolpyruvate--protein phosphotransferase [Verrucomicrobiota bacterium]